MEVWELETQTCGMQSRRYHSVLMSNVPPWTLGTTSAP